MTNALANAIEWTFIAAIVALMWALNVFRLPHIQFAAFLGILFATSAGLVLAVIALERRRKGDASRG